MWKASATGRLEKSPENAQLLECGPSRKKETSIEISYVGDCNIKTSYVDSRLFEKCSCKMAEIRKQILHLQPTLKPS